MAKLIDRQSILNEALGEYQSKGFRLVLKGEDIAILFYCDDKVAVFSWQYLTIGDLKRVCQEHIDKVEGK